MTWKQSDTNADGLLNMREFKTFIKKNNENMKKRWGESVKGTEKEDEKWYQAYNMLSPMKEGVSMDDFMTAKDMLVKIMAFKQFEPLVAKMSETMKGYSKATQEKMMEAFTAEAKNPALWDELMAEFAACWKASDANADGLLNSEEFKVFTAKNNDNMKKRFGEATMPDADEVARWYDAYNTITPGVEGVSQEDFKTADEMLKRIFTAQAFKPLLATAMDRMSKCKPETQAKMMEFFDSEEKNPALFAEGMKEFFSCW